MNNQSWDKAKLEEWKKFWESEMGKEALAKMKALKEQCLNVALNPTDPNVIAFYVGRAGGIELVIQDIQAGIRAAEEAKKEQEKEDPAKK